MSLGDQTLLPISRQEKVSSGKFTVFVTESSTFDFHLSADPDRPIHLDGYLTT